MFVCQNDRKYNQILETKLNLNDHEKLTTEDEIMMYNQDEACHKSGERVAVVVVAETKCEGIFKS